MSRQILFLIACVEDWMQKKERSQWLAWKTILTNLSTQTVSLLSLVVPAGMQDLLQNIFLKNSAGRRLKLNMHLNSDIETLLFIPVMLFLLFHKAVKRQIHWWQLKKQNNRVLLYLV